MSPVWIVAKNTFREAARDRLLTTILFFGGVLVASSVVLAPLTLGEQARIIRDLGMTAVNVFAMLLVIFVGTGLVYREIEQKTIYAVLSQPLSRTQFLLGKFLGLALTIWMQMAVMVAVFAAVSLATGAPLGGAHAAAFVLGAVELALVVAVATFFSAFTSPMLASFFAVGVWVAGNLTRNLRDIGASSELPLVVLTTRWLHRALPDLASFNLTLEAAHGLPVTGSDVWLALAYGTGYAVVVLVAAVAVFERRDFR